MTVDRHAAGIPAPDADSPAPPAPVVAPAVLGRPRRPVPRATVARLALYLRVLTVLLADGERVVASDTLAASTGVNAAMLRKDLSLIGSSGVRGVGYDVARLTAQVEQVLGLTRAHAVAVVGVGNLGHALAGYGGFIDRGFPVTALFDTDPTLVGTRIGGPAVPDGPDGGIEVLHVDDLAPVCAERGVTIGVVAVPAHAAQHVCDRFVAAGVRSILNFAPTVLAVPLGVEVRKVDLAVEMQILSFHVSRPTEVVGR